MSEELKNKSESNVAWFLGELSAGGPELVEGDNFDVACNDDSFCTVSIVDLAGDAKSIIENSNKRIAELELQVDNAHNALCAVKDSGAVREDDVIEMIERGLDNKEQK